MPVRSGRGLPVLSLALRIWPIAAADDIGLVRVGESWRYFKGAAEPAAGTTAWTGLTFDDGTWLTGTSGFGGTEATALSDYRGGYDAIYLRKAFEVSDPTRVKWLVLRVDYAGGIVVYLNGQEVARRNLGGIGEFIPSTTVANYHSPGFAEELDLTVHADQLRAGTNILAVQAHRDSQGLVCVPELLANFVRGPFIANTTTTGTQIAWRTPVFSSGWVEYGPTPALGNIASSPGIGSNHVVTLTGLLPGRVYYYRAFGYNGSQQASSPASSFRTAAAGGGVSFAVIGDTGSGGLAQFQVAAQLRLQPIDLVLHVGDIVYPMLSRARVDLRYFSVYASILDSVPFFCTVGNHELYDPTLDLNFQELFYHPTNSMTGTEHYYSFDCGDVHFVSLFVPMMEQYDQLPQYALSEGSAQYQWLTNDLASTDKPWKMLFFHQPIRNSALHRNDYSSLPEYIYAYQALQAILMPVIRQYRVDMVFNGHDHDYERFGPVGGMHSVVTGGGGYSLYSMIERDEASSQFFSMFHFLHVTVTNDTLAVRAINNNGLVFDEFVIERAMPPPRTYQAAWHTPREPWPAGGVDNGDGNLHGQRFDLAGEIIPTAAGDYSNLGQVQVDNDADFLYLGIRGAMFRSSNNVFLFLGSPQLVGRTNLAGLGNGAVDPAGQGVDGLDFLENLSFTNFQPGVAILLGDEMADAPSRSFRRPGLGLNTGQGVFRLDATFSAIPGARLQQFNRSPEGAFEVNEQNADFMVVSVPLNELGLQPGQIIHLAGIVGGPGFNQVSQGRELDRSCLGQSLRFDGANASLEPVTVRLAVESNPQILVSVEPAGPNQIRLSWPAIPGERYSVLAADNLTGEFIPIPGDSFPRTATSSVETYLVHTGSRTRQFYRVVLTR